MQIKFWLVGLTLLLSLANSTAFARNEFEAPYRRLIYPSSEHLPNNVTMTTVSPATETLILSDISAISMLAEKKGKKLNAEKIGFIGDILLAYYEAKAEQKRYPGKPNVVWLPVDRYNRNKITKLLPLLIEYLAPQQTWIEHMQLAEYWALEPLLFVKKMQEQDRHFVILDDVFEMYAAGTHDYVMMPDNVPAKERSKLYLSTMFYSPLQSMTYFVIDHDGAAFMSLDDDEVARSNVANIGNYFSTICEQQLYTFN